MSLKIVGKISFLKYSSRQGHLILLLQKPRGKFSPGISHIRLLAKKFRFDK